MAARTAVWYTVGRTPNAMFEKEIMSICDRVSRPYPVIKGAKEHQGVERPWTIFVTIRATKGSPLHKEYHFGFMEKTWEEGKFRALQEISARLCHIHQSQLEETAYHQFGRRKRDGVPDGPSSHGAYSSHSEAVETILFTTQTSLDRARDKLDLKSMQLRDAQSSARVHKRKREDYAHRYEVQKKEIERLRRLLTSTRDRLEELEGSHSRLLERVQELEDEGDDLQGATAFVSDDDDYESEADVGEMYREMGDFVVEDDEDEEEEEDPTEPDYDSAIDGSSTSS